MAALTDFHTGKLGGGGGFPSCAIVDFDLLPSKVERITFTHGIN